MMKKTEYSELRIHADYLTNRYEEDLSILEEVQNENVEFQKKTPSEKRT